jgi:plasmid stabilization system protein ParE
MNVRFTGPAFAQLGDILSDLLSKNPPAARRLAERVDEAILRIGQFPESFQEVEARPDVRRILLRYPYLMFYRVTEREVIVVAIAHGARQRPWEDP